MSMEAVEYVNAVSVTMEELVDAAEDVLTHCDASEPSQSLVDYIAALHGCGETKALAIIARMQALARFVALRRNTHLLERDSSGEWARALFMCAAAQPLISADGELEFDRESFSRRIRQLLGLRHNETLH
jgi:hypothetical protein